MPAGRFAIFRSVVLPPEMISLVPLPSMDTSWGTDESLVKAMSTAPAFAVNILAEGQAELSNRFSRRDLQERWDGVGVERWDSGVPILTGCLANLECDREHVYDGGDHVIVVGRVRRLSGSEEGKPLLYFRGAYSQLP